MKYEMAFHRQKVKINSLKNKSVYRMGKHQKKIVKYLPYLLLCGIMQFVIWAAAWQNQQNDCAPSDDSDQPGHPPSLIRVLAVRSIGC